jgi:hypothetical protein
MYASFCFSLCSRLVCQVGKTCRLQGNNATKLNYIKHNVKKFDKKILHFELTSLLSGVSLVYSVVLGITLGWIMKTNIIPRDNS